MGKLIDLTGKKFGKITVISRAGTEVSYCKGKKSCKASWNCICDCGEKVVKNTTLLNKGKYTKCKKCAYAERPQSTKRQSDIERLFQLKVTGNRLQRGIKIKMTADEYYSLAIQNCHYCGEKPSTCKIYNGKYSKKTHLVVNGVDRVDSNGAYELSNCVPCCKYCNIAKLDQPQEDFIKRIERIYNHYIKKKEKK